MSAGESTYLVQLQAQVEFKADSGIPSQRWDTLMQVLAKKVTTNGRERFAANQTTSPTTTTFEIPYLESMDPDRVNVPKTRRAVYQNRVHDIVACELVGWHRKIRFDTVSGGTVR